MSYSRTFHSMRGFGADAAPAVVPAPTSSTTTTSPADSSTTTGPTRTEVRSPTSTEVRSPTRTSTEVRSPTRTSTTTWANTRGNFTSTVTGGAGAGATSVTINVPKQCDGGLFNDPSPGKVALVLGVGTVAILLALRQMGIWK